MTGVSMLLVCVALAIAGQLLLFVVVFPAMERRDRKRPRELEILHELHRRIPTRQHK